MSWNPRNLLNVTVALSLAGLLASVVLVAMFHRLEDGPARDCAGCAAYAFAAVNLAALAADFLLRDAKSRIHES